MAKIKPTLTITSSNVLSEVLSLTMQKEITVAGNVVMKKHATSATLTTIPGTDDGVGRCIMYIKHTGKDSTGADSTSDVKIFQDVDDGGDADADAGEEIMDIASGEFALFPFAGVKNLMADADSGTPVIEYGMFFIA